MERGERGEEGGRRGGDGDCGGGEEEGVPGAREEACVGIAEGGARRHAAASSPSVEEPGSSVSSVHPSRDAATSGGCCGPQRSRASPPSPTRPPPPPPHLSLVALLLLLWATPSLGGICWTSMARSGHCVDLMSQEMEREECCSAGGASTSWSQEDMDAGALFFWRVLGGGVPCQACKETCTGVTCGEGKRCVMRKGRPKCACAPDCRHGKGTNRSQRGPVCGSDGRSYRSACRLRKRSCRKKSSSLSIAYYGHCQRSCDRIQCPDGKQCLLDQRLTPHCVKCRRNCPLLISASSYSSSLSSSSLLSSTTSSSSAPSAALAAATARHRMVCGVDGVTYLSACHLREAACRRGKAIPMAYKGRCKKTATCRSVHCREGQSCLTEPVSGRPRCVTCSQRCPRGHRKANLPPSNANSSGLSQENSSMATPKKQNAHGKGWSSWGPLCGSNERTYDSWCHMLKDACATGFVINTKHLGVCEAEGRYVQRAWLLNKWWCCIF